MFNVPVNFLAVVVCAVANMILGMLWYGPLFGKKWMELVGMTPKKTEEAKKGMVNSYAITFLLSLLAAYVLDHFIWFTSPGSVTVTIGIKTAIWAWVGFVATTSAANYLYHPDKRPWALYVLDNGYNLVMLVILGIILSVWR